MQPIAQPKIRPALDLMRATDLALLPIDRPAEANANRANIVRAQQFGNGFLDLPTNPSAALGWIHHQSASLSNRGGLIADYQLQFRAADFNAKVKLIHV